MKKSLNFTTTLGSKFNIEPGTDFSVYIWGIDKCDFRLTKSGKVLAYDMRKKVIETYPSPKAFIRKTLDFSGSKFNPVIITEPDIITGDEYFDMIIFTGDLFC